MEKIYFAKVKEEAVIPSKREEDGCYDVYACFDEEYISIMPNDIKMIPTGIASAFTSNYRMGVRERGSTGTKGMSVRAGQIDSGYRGEWFIPINNTSNKIIIIAKDIEKIKDELGLSEEHATIYPYTKAIAQVALEKVPTANVEEISFNELQQIKSERGDGKLGSSNK